MQKCKCKTSTLHTALEWIEIKNFKAFACRIKFPHAYNSCIMMSGKLFSYEAHNAVHNDIKSEIHYSIWELAKNLWNGWSTITQKET